MSTNRGPRNQAAVDLLRVANEAGPRLSYPVLSAETGIPVNTLKKVFTNQTELTMDSFLRLANAIGIPEKDALAALLEVVFD